MSSLPYSNHTTISTASHCQAPSSAAKPKKEAANPISRDCRLLFVVLGNDKRLSVHPIGVTQHAQRADLELINPSQREPTDGYLIGFDHRNDRPLPQHAAIAECVPHIVSNRAGLFVRLHNNVTAVGTAIDRAELRVSQLHRRGILGTDTELCSPGIRCLSQIHSDPLQIQLKTALHPNKM